MNRQHGDPRFYKLLEEIAELHSRKNHDYSKANEPLSNFHRSEALGVEPWRGVLVRMSDKWSRIEQLATGKTPKNESMRDSLIDLAVYALIDVLLMEDAPALPVGANVHGLGPDTDGGANPDYVEPAEVVDDKGHSGFVPGVKMGAR